MNKAVFLDRDGVINSDVGHYYVYKISDFKLNLGVVEAMQRWQQEGYLLIIISNQGGVNKKVYSKEQVQQLHAWLAGELAKEGIELSAAYFCPHHSNYQQCLCRKPNSLNIEKAIARFNVDINKSFMIGDRASDIEAAERAGLKGVKIDSNRNLMEVDNLFTHE